MVLETPRIATAVTSSTSAPLPSSALTIQSYMIPQGKWFLFVWMFYFVSNIGCEYIGFYVIRYFAWPRPVTSTTSASSATTAATTSTAATTTTFTSAAATPNYFEAECLSKTEYTEETRHWRVSFSRDFHTIVRRYRFIHISTEFSRSSMTKAQRNLGPLLNTVSVTSTTAPSSPPSPHLPDVGGGQSSNSSSTLSATSSPGVPSMDPESPTSKVEKAQVTIVAPSCDEEQLRSAASLVEMSPRKKPRKQQLWASPCYF